MMAVAILLGVRRVAAGRWRVPTLRTRYRGELPRSPRRATRRHRSWDRDRWAGLTRRWPRDVAAGRLTALLVGVALVAVPYIVLTGKLTKKPAGDYLTNPFDNQPPPMWRLQLETGRTPNAAVGPLFAKWWDPLKDEGKCRELWAVGAVADEVSKALHFVVGGLAVIGLIAHRRELFGPDPGMWVLVILGLLSLGLMIYLATRIGYVSERHTLLFVMISCVFAAAALEPLALFFESFPVLGRLVIWPKVAPGTLLVALVAALPFTLADARSARAQDAGLRVCRAHG